MKIEKATIDDNYILTEITKKSKAYWGYSEEQILVWNDLLTITKEYIESTFVFKLVDGTKIIGYYSYYYSGEFAIKLDNFFILPEYINKGFGRFMMKDFLNRLDHSNAGKVTLDSEPHAESFYQKMGFITIGLLETPIENRFLPIMALHLPK